MKTEEQKDESISPDKPREANLQRNLLAIAGSIAGAVLGYFGFLWLLRQGLYAIALPGVLVGLGASVSKSQSKRICIASALLALAAGLFTEWRTFPFAADASLSYFLAHIYQLRPITLIMLAVGVAAGYAIPLRKPSA